MMIFVIGDFGKMIGCFCWKGILLEGMLEGNFVGRILFVFPTKTSSENSDKFRPGRVSI
jgi:hypothetical protein